MPGIELPNSRSTLRLLAAFALGLLLLAGLGCDRKKIAPATARSTNAVPAWNWDFYPLAPRMRLAQLPCQLLPKSMISMYSPLAGVLRVYVTTPQTNLTAGFVWAEFEPNIFAAESEALEEARVKLEEREKLQLQLEVPKAKLRLQREMEEAQRQVDLMRLLSTNKELAAMTLDLGGPTATLLRPDTLGRAELELGFMRQSMDYLASTNLLVLGIDLPGQRSEWQRRKLEFDRRQAQARVKMPFTGQLTVSLPLTEKVEEYPVTLNQELAIARDLSSIRLRVPVANIAWTALSPEQLTAVIRLPSGQELRAPFIFQKVERVQAREEAVYYFQFPEKESAAAARLIGTDVSCEIWYQLPQPARIVPKLSLVMHNPDAFQGRNWAAGTLVAWPGAEMIVEGQTDLAILEPKKP